jgi:hypothetical protein
VRKVKERIPDGMGGFEVIYEDCEHVEILGVEYTIYERDRHKDKQLDDKDGYCDDSVKEIVTARLEREVDSKKDLNAVRQKILRHEIVHAFLCESGLGSNSNPVDGAWAHNEEMVDWIALQGPKIYEAWQEAGAI